MTQTPNASNAELGNASGLKVENVSVTYPNGHRALYDANFEIPKASIAALVGINGSGKSTLFKAIMGFAKTSSGSISLGGQDGKTALKANRVAYVPQSEEVDWDFPILVEDVVMMGRYGHMNFLRIPKRADKELVEASLRRVSLWDERKRQIGELSGGQKKRVFLARALAQQSDIILLDEPFTGVDVKTEEQIIELMRELRNEGKVMLVSTHNLGSVPRFCDQTILIKGTILAYGKTSDIFTKENLEKTFDGVLRSFVLEGPDLHDDDDARKVTVLTDDERPFVIYGDDTDKPS